MNNENLDKIEQMLECIEKIKNDFLLRNGWEKTVDYNILLWKKELQKGYTIITYKDMALEIEKSIKK